MTDPRTFAATAHAGQTYGAEPYTVHLEAVAALVRGVDPSEEAEAVAYLHDVVEDTGTGTIDLFHAFGARVATAVKLLTDPEGHPNRRTRKAELHLTLAGLDASGVTERLTLLVKAADRLANVRACVASGDSRIGMYRREYPAFRTAAYRPGLCDDIWAELDSLLAVTG
jgi:(p)ppGpp synthase/HD superfamily hydrolase